MRLQEKFKQYIRNMKFRAKLNITYMILVVIPIIIMSFGYYKTSADIIIRNAESNAYNVIKNNNKTIDLKLSKVIKSSDAITVDHELYTILSRNKKYDDYELVDLDKQINKIIYKYFNDDDIFSAHIITSYYNFGSSAIPIPFNYFNMSKLYKDANDFKGRLRWIPTYDFSDIYNQAYLKNIELDFKYLFSAVKIVNSLDNTNNLFKSLPKDVERPLLIVNFKADMFSPIVDEYRPIAESKYYIFSTTGDIVYSSDKKKLGVQQNPTWFNEAVKNKSGIVNKKIDGKNTIICYDTLTTTGWISATVIPVDVILKDLTNVRNFILYIGMVLIVLVFISANLISKSITKPINMLHVAIKKMGQGKFSTKVEVKGNDEIGNLAKKFNEMDDKIIELIEENYIRKIREKEATIMCLNIQLNPHFLYNTLNIINWMAIEKEEKQISKMIMNLSSMLQYTAHNREENADFETDLKWIKEYIYIMENRFEDKFITYYDIDPQLNIYMVPKLFLQPFVENSILHGFANIDNEGALYISAWVSGERAFFSVEDNGAGMDSNKIKEIMTKSSKRIGMTNVNKRIQLMYGEEYGVHIESELNKSTKILIELPLKNKL